MDSGYTSAPQRLRWAGLRVTAPRHAVLEWLAEHPHATAEQVSEGVRQRLGSVSLQGVYTVLAACTDAGLVRRIEPAGHPARFECRASDNHHHLACRWCGSIEDVDCAVGARPCLTPSNNHGFSVDEAEVVFWGACPACRAGSSDGMAPASGPPRDQHSEDPDTPETSSAQHTMEERP